MEDIGLAMRHRLKLELISYTSYSCLLFFFFEDFKIAIEGLKPDDIKFLFLKMKFMTLY